MNPASKTELTDPLNRKPTKKSAANLYKEGEISMKNNNKKWDIESKKLPATQKQTKTEDQARKWFLHLLIIGCTIMAMYAFYLG